MTHVEMRWSLPLLCKFWLLVQSDIVKVSSIKCLVTISWQNNSAKKNSVFDAWLYVTNLEVHHWRFISLAILGRLWTAHLWHENTPNEKYFHTFASAREEMFSQVSATSTFVTCGV